MEQIDVEMENVEFLRVLTYLIDHQHKVRNAVVHGWIEPKRAAATWIQLGAGDGIPTCKQRHIMTKPNKLFRQIGNDPFSAAIETRRNALNERSHLRDFHNVLCLSLIHI